MMTERKINLFVPGRLCLFGEHSDWAGKYRAMNANIVPGAALVTGIEQGIHATVEKDHTFKVISDAPEIADIWQDFECRMDFDELKKVAKSGSFFSYCAGVASYMLEWYKVGGGENSPYQNGYADEERTVFVGSHLRAGMQSLQPAL